MNVKRYRSVIDFIDDESFNNYVNNTDERTVNYWKNWLSENTEMKKECETAQKIVKGLQNINKEHVDIDKSNELNLLLEKIYKSEKALRPSFSPGNFLLRFAAVILLAIGLNLIWGLFKNNSSAVQGNIATNEIIVPIGEKAQLVLSDGSHVWINSGSRFVYPVSFDNETRHVTLEGEAYFDIEKRNGSKFIVQTHDAEIEVLGTTFNVKSYPEDMKSQMTLLSGSIHLTTENKSVILSPAQMAIIVKMPTGGSDEVGENILTIFDNVNTYAISSWKNDILSFENETFADIAVKMERWYNTKITIADENLKRERYTGEFVHNETIYEVLGILNRTTSITFEEQDNEFIIKKL